ncbi:Cytochrome b5 isoform A [Linum grandiflorum]
MPELTKLVSMQEASEHNSKDDCWIVIDGKVYDVSSYLDDHPGGDDVLLQATGKDATDDFEDAGHSETAREELKTFFIGELDTTTAPAIPELKIISKKNQPSDSVKKLKDLTQQYWAVPVAAVGISVAVGGIIVYLRKK